MTEPTDAGETSAQDAEISEAPEAKPAGTVVPPRGAAKKKSNRPAASRTTATGRAPAAGRPSAGRPAPKGAAATAGSGGVKTSTNRRQAEWQARRRRNMMLSGVAVAVVVVIVGVFIGIKATDGGTTTNSSKLKASNGSVGNNPGTSTLPPSAATVLQVPLSALAAASKGTTVPTLTGGSTISKEPPLSANGLPEMLYIGAEYCPFCAAERWAMVAALSKFGTFTNLSSTASSGSDSLPNSPTFSFYGSTYTSPYLTFTPVETQTQVEGQSLQNPTADQAALWKKLDASETIPFIDIGNKYLISGATYDSSSISNTTFDSVAAQVGNNNTTVGKGIDQAAGAMIKAICQLTNNKPANVCSAIGS